MSIKSILKHWDNQYIEEEIEFLNISNLKFTNLTINEIESIKSWIELRIEQYQRTPKFVKVFSILTECLITVFVLNKQYDQVLKLILMYKDKYQEFAIQIELNLKLADLLNMFELKHQSLFLYKEQLNIAEQQNLDDLKIKILFHLTKSKHPLNLFENWIQEIKIDETNNNYNNEKRFILAQYYYEKKDYKSSYDNFKLLNIEYFNEKKLTQVVEYITEFIDVCHHLQMKNEITKIIKFLDSKHDTLNFVDLNIKRKMYFSLVQYHKTKKDFDKGTYYLNKLSETEEELHQLRKIVISNMDYLNFNQPKAIFKNHLETFFGVTQLNIHLKNYSGEIHKVNVQSIIYIQTDKLGIKVFFSNQSFDYYVVSIYNFFEILNQYNSINKLFVYVKARSIIVNIFWATKFDKTKKMLTLNALGKVYNFSVSRRQIDDLLKLF